MFEYVLIISFLHSFQIFYFYIYHSIDVQNVK